MAPNKPMPLENLPEYLKSSKGVGSPVVDIGQIIIPKRSYLKQIVFATLMFLVLGAGSLVTYDSMSTKQMTVVVDVNRATDIQTISKIVSDSGGEVIAVKQRDDSTYEVKLKTRKSIDAFLEWLRKNRDVKKAELEE